MDPDFAAAEEEEDSEVVLDSEVIPLSERDTSLLDDLGGDLVEQEFSKMTRDQVAEIEKIVEDSSTEDVLQEDGVEDELGTQPIISDDENNNGALKAGPE